MSGQVLEFGDPCIGMIVWIVDGPDRLMALDIRQIFMLEAQITVGRAAETIVEISVDRPGVDNLFGRK